MFLHFFVFPVLFLVMISGASLNSAEARSDSEPCSYLHKSWKINPSTGICGPSIIHKSSSAQNYPMNNPTNTFQQINCGEGTILKGNSCVIDFRHEVAAQGQMGGSSDMFLPITNLFDNMPDFPKIDPVQIGFFAAIFIASIFIVRQFSRKKRIARKNRREWGNNRREWPIGSAEGLGVLRVTPEEYTRMKAFERSLATVGKSDPEYFLHVTSGAKLIDASRRGNELYSIDTIIRGRSLRLVKYRDPSTGQVYVCFVEEHFNKADHAMAWKFGLTPSEYSRTKGNEA
jgi:hypothetical protein